MFRNLMLTLIALVIVIPSAPRAEAAEEIVVYSARKAHLIRPLFEAYTKKTGVKITYITDKAGPLMQRLKAEGANTRADLLITVDAGNLWHAANEGLLAPVNSKVLDKNIPKHLKDPKNRWFGLSVRARTIVYHTGRVPLKELSTYEALADPAWKGRLCLRTSKKVYNQSLVAMMIAEHGEAKTERVIKGWVENLVTKPFSNDTKVMKAIIAGRCDVGIINTYYFGRLLKKNSDIPLALFWPNQNSSGVHVNVSGAGVVAHSKNKAAATRLIEWFSSTQAQNLFTDANMEYPVNPNVKMHKYLASWGTFKQNVINVSRAGALQAAAIKLMDRAKYK